MTVVDIGEAKCYHVTKPMPHATMTSKIPTGDLSWSWTELSTPVVTELLSWTQGEAGFIGVLCRATVWRLSANPGPCWKTPHAGAL